MPLIQAVVESTARNILLEEGDFAYFESSRFENGTTQYIHRRR